jgi:hypothetical protein
VIEVTVSSHYPFLSSYDLASFTTVNADLELIYKIYSNDNSAPLKVANKRRFEAMLTNVRVMAIYTREH